MGEPVPPDDGIEPHYRALIALHSLSPDFRAEREKLPEEYRGRDIGADRRSVAEASPEQIPVSERLAVLYDLAKADYPGWADHEDAYLALADTAVQFRVRRTEGEGFAPADLLAEIKAAADAREPLSARPRAAEDFVHHEVAFIGRDVCTIQRVRVGGIRAVWIYSEFETDASFDSIATWLDPHHWPDLSSSFFRRMDPIGPLDVLAPTTPLSGDPHWQGVFHEEVQLVERLNTVLRCDYWRDGAASAATTYDLELSPDHQIDVDSGYLLVTHAGGRRRVQVLKIVSFTQNWWDFIALFVCPFWTEWIRGAVRDGSNTTVVDPPTLTPDSGSSPVAEAVEQWIEYFG